MADPLFNTLLQRAEGIGPAPLPEVKLGMMPLPPMGRLLGGLSKLLRRPTTVQPISKNAPTLGEHLPEFTPVGGEALLNANRAAPSVIQKVYQNILSKGGR